MGGEGGDFAAVDEDGKIDWHASRARGLQFCYLNCTPGNSVWDQATAARAAGVKVGPYLYLTPTSKEEGNEQVARNLRGFVHTAHDLPLVLDVELGKRGIAGTGLSQANVCFWYLDAYEASAAIAGYDPGLYSSQRVLDTNDTDTLHRGLDKLADRAWLWLARYGVAAPPVPAAWGPNAYFIHQDRGDVKGLFGIKQVDHDRWHYVQHGDVGSHVALLQKKMRITVTGHFDNSTVAAVCNQQRLNGLVVDGIVGPDTASVILVLP